MYRLASSAMTVFKNVDFFDIVNFFEKVNYSSGPVFNPQNRGNRHNCDLKDHTIERKVHMLPFYPKFDL